MLALSVLTGAVLATFIAQSNTSTLTTYALAAILVLLPLSIVCDVFYAKYEPVKKTGAATVVMVIHAVIFALFGIGSLIVAVFSIVQMLTSAGDHTSSQIALYTSLVIFVVYLAVFLRTLNLEQLPWLRKAFIGFMLVAVGLVGVLGVIGPIAHERATRDDRLIEQNISVIEQEISDYANSNNKLPNQLTDMIISGNAKELIDRKLVVYTPNTLPSSTSADSLSDLEEIQIGRKKEVIYYYTLCANYKKASSKNNRAPYADDISKDRSGYSTYISAYSHPAGEVCYKVKTTDYLSY